MVITVPDDGVVLYPTLGPQLCAFIEERLVFGPGDLRGLPAVIDDEKRALIYRMYEVFPAGHTRAGRRRFPRCGLSLAKGKAKTELAAWIAACELHPEAPVRCTGFDAAGEPIGGPVTDPYIPMVAYTEEQSDELCYGALLAMISEGPMADDFDIGLERITRRKGDGKAVSLSSSPSARDGARSTFIVCDETHWWVSPRLKQAHQTMSNNLAKRKLSDPWMLETTTAPEPGRGSVAEATMEYARAIEAGRVSDASLFYYHLQASDDHDLTTEEGARAAVIEASGPSYVWRDIDGILALWKDPTTDRAFWERVWCNRLVKSSGQAFDVERWKALATAVSPVKAGDRIVIGFDGSMFHDATAIVATHASGYQWLVRLWERPDGVAEWKVSTEEVDATIADLFARYTVVRMYADPPYWETYVAKWIGLYGKERVHEWWTNRRGPMTGALRSFVTAMRDGAIAHDGHADVTRHLANARKQEYDGQLDEKGQKPYVITKERSDSPHKIDAAMATVLSREAFNDAVAAGEMSPVPEPQLFFIGGRP